MIEFQYNLTKKNHFKSLLKSQLKTIIFFLLIFTFCYFAINLEAFIYNFPYNTPIVLITYFIYLLIIFIIMFLISIIFSYAMTLIFRKNNAYQIYNYKLTKDKLIEVKTNFSLNLNEIKNIKFTKKSIKIVSLKLKQIITFEKINFVVPEDFIKFKNLLIKEKNKVGNL